MRFRILFQPVISCSLFIRNAAGEILLVRRAKDPAKGTLDLPGGFVDMHESAEEAAHREVKEETGLDITECRYLFSIPNLYMYSGFEVHTVDMFFECLVDNFNGAHAEDDAAEVVILKKGELNADDFGLMSIKKGIEIYRKNNN